MMCLLKNSRRLMASIGIRSKKLPKRNFSVTASHRAKLFHETENIYCYGIIAPLGISTNRITQLQMNSDHQVTTILKHNHRNKTATEIVQSFRNLLPYCKAKNLTLADPMFDNLVDGLMDNALKLKDDELLMLLELLTQFPACESATAHNFHDIWSCLDDICCWRLPRWDANMIFAVADCWYKLNLAQLSDFIFEAIDKLSNKPRRLTKDQLVQVFFLMNISRKRPLMFEYENALYELIEQCSVDELAVIALGFFKSQSKIKIPQIMAEMLRKLKQEEHIHEMTLCAILKVCRYSSHAILADQIYDFMVHITPRLPQMSTMCVLHAALLGTTLQLQYEPVMHIAAQRIATNITNPDEVRLKDIERILLVLTMFDYDPQTTPCVYEASMAELTHSRRDPEHVKHPRCLPAAQSFLAIRGFYSHAALDRILNVDFVNEMYGKDARQLPREVFVLDANIDVEVPEYAGPRLGDDKRRRAAKYLTAHTPAWTQKPKKVSAADKLILWVLDAVEACVGGRDKMMVDHVLPQYLRADIVVCRNKHTKQFLQPEGFDGYVLGDIMRAPSTPNVDYIAIVVVGINNTIRNTKLPVGLVNMKLRHLKSIGYKPIPIIWSDFESLTTDEKKNYMESKLNSVI